MLIVAPQSNSHGKFDASGAFQPEAKRFAELHADPGHRVHLFDNLRGLTQRRAAFLRFLEHRPVGGRVASFYCHGWPRGIQLGFMSGQVSLLASALVTALPDHSSERPLIVNLACCDCARDSDDDREDDVTEDGPGGIGGFADQLCDRIAALGAPCRVFAHATLGHTTSNPYVRVFDSQDAHPAGGTWVVAPRSSLWKRWRVALRETTLRHRFPLLSPEDLDRELGTLGVA